MPSPLDGATGERLELAAYYADFREQYALATEFWKLERGQVFAEPGNESWRAFDRGDWAEALRLGEGRRAELAAAEQEDAERGMTSRRIRIVSLPPSDYLLWGLHILKIRDEAGEAIRVLRDSEVADLEDRGPLPDLNLMNNGVMYQVIYDANGVIDHALRYSDDALVRRCQGFIANLFARGEPIADFFRREIAHLPPPSAQHAVPHDYLERMGRAERPRR